jgi:hypothetical protein
MPVSQIAKRIVPPGVLSTLLRESRLRPVEKTSSRHPSCEILRELEANMGLQEEIDKTRAEIRSDGYAISVGEWISIYDKRELDIHPEFQRFFRWSLRQKSRLIESLLLGIPIPQIFVAQRPDGIWGDLKSPAASLIGMEYVMAFAEVAKEFGYEILQPIKDPEGN